MINLMFDDICKFLGIQHTRQQLAVRETLGFDLGKVLTLEDATRLALQVGHNQERLLDGKPLIPFTGVGAETWIPFEIVGAEAVRQGTMMRSQMSLLVVGGPFAGYRATRHCSLGFMARFAYDLGFSRKCQYERPDQLTGMQFAGWVTPSDSTDMEFQYYWMTSAMAKRNREAVARFREQETV